MVFELQFSIEGSEPQPYRVRVGTEQGRVVADCSCRFGKTLQGKLLLCKHRRAVLQADNRVLALPPASLEPLTAWIARNQAAVKDLLAGRADPASVKLPRPQAAQARAIRVGTAACVDIETTGVSPKTDQITEIGIALFRFDHDTGRILGVVDVHSSLEEPKVPIPAHVSALTSITAQLVQGRAIDWTSVARFLDQAEFLIAHNADFERRFLSHIPGLLDGRRLFCSQQIPVWHPPGARSSVRLEDLTEAHGIPHVAHRAFGDVLAMVHLLGVPSPITGKPFFAEVLRAAQVSSYPTSPLAGQGRRPASRRAQTPIPW